MLNYYHETIQINVVTTGLHIFSSISIVDTYGYIYKNNFNPLNPFENLLAQDDDSSGSGQFKLNIYLQASTTYILVVTTSDPNVIGAFSIFVYGPNNVYINRTSEYLYYFVNNPHRIQKMYVNSVSIPNS
jgi:hypothetical protein